MGLLTKEVEINVSNKTVSHYMNLGYKILQKINKRGKLVYVLNYKITVKVNDLPYGSGIKIHVKCDCPDCKNPYLKPIRWEQYLRCVKEDGKYYCNKCALKLYGAENIRLNKLKNGKSFEQWCIENNRQDVLDRWDYELNDYKPSEISYSSTKGVYFKCPKGVHESELKILDHIIFNQIKTTSCKRCNSFAQWGIDNIGEDFLEKYWDYEKNTVDPWNIAPQHGKKVWIKCQEKDYHESSPIYPYNFLLYGQRCVYCSKSSSKVHPLDSLGKLLEENRLLNLWSDKNNKSPYQYAPKSSKKTYWKCPDGIHKDYLRKISGSNLLDFRCPECQFSKGEKRIQELLDLGNIGYISQKEFPNLLGINNGNLSYDFYLPQHNLLIEYQGEFHDGSVGKKAQSKKDFERQQEHDRRKKEYALQNNYNFLEIWYWDFDNIETILEEKINSLKEVVLTA